MSLLIWCMDSKHHHAHLITKPFLWENVEIFISCYKGTWLNYCWSISLYFIWAQLIQHNFITYFLYFPFNLLSANSTRKVIWDFTWKASQYSTPLPGSVGTGNWNKLGINELLRGVSWGWAWERYPILQKPSSYVLHAASLERHCTSSTDTYL